MSPIIYYMIIIITWMILAFISTKYIRQISLIISFLIFIWSLYMSLIFQYYTIIFDDSMLVYTFSLWNMSYQIQIDGISILFILLSNLLLFLCILINWI